MSQHQWVRAQSHKQSILFPSLYDLCFSGAVSICTNWLIPKPQYFIVWMNDNRGSARNLFSRKNHLIFLIFIIQLIFRQNEWRAVAQCAHGQKIKDKVGRCVYLVFSEIFTKNYMHDEKWRKFFFSILSFKIYEWFLNYMHS